MTTDRNSQAPGTEPGASPVMTAAELRATRELLGLTAEWLADQVGVALRTVRRWEHGQSPVPPGVAADVAALAEDTADFVGQVVDELRGTADEDPEPWLITYATDEAYRAEHPDQPWPASWHRAAMARVVDAYPAARLRYLQPATED